MRGDSLMEVGHVEHPLALKCLLPLLLYNRRAEGAAKEGRKERREGGRKYGQGTDRKM